jgi:ATP-dependent helicase/nuclease subunit A
MVRFEQMTSEQKTAIRTLDRNITLTAGAGTGKTTTLTKRYLRCIEDSLASDASRHTLPENILTTTFTNRAASELEASIRSEISDRIESLDVSEYGTWRAVADGLDDGYIATLHGFCARLLREHALRAEGVDPGFETLEDAEAQSLIDETVHTILDDNDQDGTVTILAEQFSRPQLHNILVDMIGQRPDSTRWAERWHDSTTEEYLEFVDATLHPIDAETAADRLADPAFVEPAKRLIQIVSDPPAEGIGGKVWQRAKAVVRMLDDGFDDGVTSHQKRALIAEVLC